ncbi:cytochrome P450 [Lindgomyces ingoldianus]|uniref:Cytochrome P450 n=1 Tax=Lindgomyces ingoldianus TaxID=673940 RepID=A0ACB6QH94_9PLEO|nr:cytochrome P450 [Lindgomyces ingoldianus]KAF2465515.1 cytochrome P450 [Lindgomyces ingoldianus]
MLNFACPSSLPIIIFLLPALFVSYILYKYLKNPLRHVPAAHPLAPFTSLWILYIRLYAIENRTLKAAHERLGPVICLSPEEISVNCVKGGIRDVYAGGMEKGEEGKSVVTSSSALQAQSSAILYNRFLPFLSSILSQANPGVLNIYALLSATTMDIVTSYIFGLASGSNLIDNPDKLDRFLDLYNSRRSHNFWPQELPRFTKALQKWVGYRLVPKWVEEANAEIEGWTKGMCDNAIKVLRQSGVKTKDIPIVYQRLSTALSREAKNSDNEKADLTLSIASEVLDHLAAGFDTSGITLTYLIHELSLRPDAQSRLRSELLTLSPPLSPSSAPTLPDPKTVDTLPLLHAVIWETLRLHPAIPGPQPRVTPLSGCHLGPEECSFYIPGGVRVSASAGLLHMNEDVYPEATQWRPERWLEDVSEEKRKDMESRWFWAFGRLGRNLLLETVAEECVLEAIWRFTYIVAALYSNFTTTIVDDTDIEQSDAYTAPPKSDKLMIKLSHVKSG